MAEIWNLSTLCRCCHADGHFKSLNLIYQGKKGVEIYENMLKDTLGITISRPQLEASYTICEACITKLRDATDFKTQVQACEQKFRVYCENEQFISNPGIKTEVDAETSDNDNDYHCADDDEDGNKEMIKYSVEVIKEENIIKTDKTDNTEDLKEEKPEKVFEVPIINPLEDQKPSTVEEETKKDIKIPVKRKRIRRNVTKNDTAPFTNPYVIKEQIDNSTKYSCKKCGESFNKLQQINTHLRREHTGNFKCEYCPTVLKTYFHLLNHLKLHVKGEKGLQCKKCPRTFTNKDIFHDHIQLHGELNKYFCDICQKEYTSKGILTKHFRIHAGLNKPVLCDICGWSFTDKTNLKIHIDTVHLKLRPFECKICKKTFPYNKRLKQHMQKIHIEKGLEKEVTYRQETDFKCHMCLEIFDTRTARKNHVYKVHLSKYTCPLCGKILSDQYCLERHIELHKGIRNFTCEICGEKFSQKSILKRHLLRKHNPDASQVKVVWTKCELCKRKFRNIKVHMERHRIRNFSCEICGEAFALNSSLKRHRDQKHLGKRLFCEVCNKPYLHRTKLNTHMLKVHNIKIEKKEKNYIANSTLKCYEKTEKCESDSRSQSSVPLCINK